ncbi:MAG: hypothetical protein KIT19_06370 [Phycisphaeraceae bacterium]|nr:hypothetical protein [Phycisphaeraceae bacterium]
MEAALVILGGILVVAGLIAIAIQAHKAHLRRLAALRAFADSMGWTFFTRQDRSHDDEYAHFAAFRRGTNRHAFNTMQGPLSIGGHVYRAKAGDFYYEIQQTNGKNTSTSRYTFSYLILEAPFAGIPDMYIRREGVIDKLAGMLGFDDIDFESAEFSRRFHVSGRDKRFVYDIVSPPMMEYLMKSLPGFVEIEHGRFLITDATTRWKPEHYPSMVNWAKGFFELWPRHVIRQLEEASSSGRRA